MLVRTTVFSFNMEFDGFFGLHRRCLQMGMSVIFGSVHKHELYFGFAFGHAGDMERPGPVFLMLVNLQNLFVFNFPVEKIIIAKLVAMDVLAMLTDKFHLKK